jgi:tetratricopeptide (TPR) repeat protein
MLKVMRKLLPNKVATLAFALILAIFALETLPVRSQTVDEQYLAGCAYYIKGNFNMAAESFSLAIVRNNSDEQLYIKRGASRLKLNDFSGAIDDFTEANQILPDVADVWLARSYALSGDYAKAISSLKMHLSSTFRLAEDSIKKDPAFDKIQMTDDWYNLWQQEWYSESEKAAKDANYFAAKKNFDKALALLDDEIAKGSADADIPFLKGDFDVKQGNFAVAIADYSKALSLDKYMTIVYARRGLAYLKAGRFKDAVNDLNKAVKADPGNFNLYVQRSEAYAGQESWQSAIKDITFYLKYFENDFEALYKCGEYYYGSEDYMNALKCFNLNLKEDPNNGLYYKARGKTYLKTATYRYAISDLAMSLDLLPDDSETWMYLGIAKIQSGDAENGCSDLKKAQQLGNVQAVKYELDNCK